MQVNSRRRGILITVLGLAGFAAALLSSQWRFAGIGAAVVFLLFGATAFSNATRIAGSLRPFVKKSVRVEVWGAPLLSSSEAIFEIDSVSAFGAGLLIYLRAPSGSPRSLLKVAQPGSPSLQEDRIAIGEARYVSWAGTKLQPALDKSGPALVLYTRPDPGLNENKHVERRP